MSSALYSLLHFLVDLCCAHAMFRVFLDRPDGYAAILLYNFCAFALQMPLGALLDSLASRHRRLPAVFAALGVMLTILGSFTHPVVLGLGNALFHVGGGVDVIREDNARVWKGRALGVFVAPGALGLFLGTQSSGAHWVFPACAALMILFLVPLFLRSGYEDPPLKEDFPAPKTCPADVAAALCCFLVVILRSYVGMAVVFSWKQGLVLSLIAVLAVVLGKAAGGVFAARFGARNTAVVSLALAMVCYFLGNEAVFGIGALFFFNMTMPLTLYQLARRYPVLPGFSFGFLTFGLFLGFLPVYAGVTLPVVGTVLGAAGCLLSLILLVPVCRREGL